MSPNNIPQFGQLIEAGAAKKRAKAGNPLLIGISAWSHGPKLKHGERRSMQAGGGCRKKMSFPIATQMHTATTNMIGAAIKSVTPAIAISTLLLKIRVPLIRSETVAHQSLS
jgi:hypothetical protein